MNRTIPLDLGGLLAVSADACGVPPSTSDKILAIPGRTAAHFDEHGSHQPTDLLQMSLGNKYFCQHQYKITNPCLDTGNDLMSAMVI